MKKIVGVLVGLALIFHTAAGAEKFYGLDSVHLADAFLVKVTDHVTRGCWTNVKAVKTEMELILRGNGIKVAEDRADMGIHCKAHGGRHSDGFCSADIDCQLESSGMHPFGFDSAVGTLILHSGGGVATGGATINGYAMEAASSFTKEVANVYLKQKQERSE